MGLLPQFALQCSRRGTRVKRAATFVIRDRQSHPPAGEIWGKVT